MISVLILTKNEEQDLPACLASVAWSDDIHVLDSYSTDATVALAESAGAQVWYRAFDYFSAHQNWALENIKFRHPWVLYVDADERVPTALADAARSVVSDYGDIVAFRIQRRDFFMGRHLKHVQASPFYIRLFRPEKMRYGRMGHPVSLPDGPVGELSGCFLDHFPFSKGLHHWIDRHNRYSTEEALQTLENRANHVEFSLRKALFSPDFNERRYHQKELFYRLPARPIIKFAGLYFGKRGFLDGKAGFVYAALQAFYEYMIVLKTAENDQGAVAANKVFGFPGDLSEVSPSPHTRGEQMG